MKKQIFLILAGLLFISAKAMEQKPKSYFDNEAINFLRTVDLKLIDALISNNKDTFDKTKLTATIKDLNNINDFIVKTREELTKRLSDDAKKGLKLDAEKTKIFKKAFNLEKEINNAIQLQKKSSAPKIPNKTSRKNPKEVTVKPEVKVARPKSELIENISVEVGSKGTKKLPDWMKQPVKKETKIGKLVEQQSKETVREEAVKKLNRLEKMKLQTNTTKIEELMAEKTEDPKIYAALKNLLENSSEDQLIKITENDILKITDPEAFKALQKEKVQIEMEKSKKEKERENYKKEQEKIQSQMKEEEKRIAEQDKEEKNLDKIKSEKEIIEQAKNLRSTNSNLSTYMLNTNEKLFSLEKKSAQEISSDISNLLKLLENEIKLPEKDRKYTDAKIQIFIKQIINFLNKNSVESKFALLNSALKNFKFTAEKILKNLKLADVKVSQDQQRLNAFINDITKNAKNQD